MLALGAAITAPAQDGLLIARAGSQPAALAPAEHFTGKATVENFFERRDPSRVSGTSVSFEPGARTDWHTHEFGQTLVVTAGRGRVQQWDGPVQEVSAGDVIYTLPGSKHWHGAAPDTAMTNFSIVERPDSGSGTNWLENVTDEQYAGAAQLPTAAQTAAGDEQPSRAQQLMGDIAPQLAQLTDEVLYGQVWADPALSQRDRSLVTVSALIAMHRPDQLRSHLTRARSNGLTQAELIAAITHLAFYTGWPNSVSAVTVAREVFAAESATKESSSTIPALTGAESQRK